MPTPDLLLDTIQAAYAAGLDDALWPQVLQGITQLCGGVGTTLEIFDKQAQRHRAFYAVGVPAKLEKAYLDYWAPRSPRVIHGQHLKPGAIGWDYQFLDERGMNRDGFYSELLPMTDFRYFISGTLTNSRSEYAVVAVQRTRKQGHVDDAEVAIMQRLVPHLQQALDMAARLKGSAQASRTLEHALDWLNDGATLVRRDGRVVHANTRFDGLIALRDGIELSKGSIRFGAPEARSRFDAALGALARMPDTAVAADDFPVARPSGAPAYIVSVRPLQGRHPHDAAAIVFIRDPMAHNTAAMQLLREMFGFTPAEAALAHALQVGISPAAYARDRRVSLNTVYTHLRRIKDKTGWGRIAEINRRLNELRVPSRRA
jgi:DNA-binding CsgD family transcriptional regulator